MDPLILTPSPSDAAPSATLYYGNCAQKVLSALPDGYAHTIITELPAPAMGDYPETEWPAIELALNPLLPDHRVVVEAGRCTYGSEATVLEHVAHTVHVFRLAKRVLRPDGTLWFHARDRYVEKKQLGMIPQHIALALQADGWVLRNEIIWQRDNTTPESARDRLSRTHGTLFMMAHPESSKKGATYYYDADSIREPHRSLDEKHLSSYNKNTNMADGYARRPKKDKAWHPRGRNRRTVWSVNLGAYLGKAMSPWPLNLVETMVKASVPGPGGVCAKCRTPFTLGEKDDNWGPNCDCNAGNPARAMVLDPFSGTAVTGKAAMDWGASFTGIDIDRGVLSEAIARIEGLTHSRKALQETASPILDLFA